MKFIHAPGLLGLFLIVLSTAAYADATSELIALDKKWGSAGMAGDTETVATLLSDQLVDVSGSGIGGKSENLADSEPAPEGATYEPSNFKVTFLDDNTAIMTHEVSGEVPHYSLHVWSRSSGAWQVIATSSTPAASE